LTDWFAAGKTEFLADQDGCAEERDQTQRGEDYE